MIIYEAKPGEDISTAAKCMIGLAIANDEEVQTDFNEIKLVADKSNTIKEVVAGYHTKTAARSKAYRESDEYKKQQAKREKEQSQKNLALQKALDLAPTVMSFSDKEGWEKTIGANQNGYGAAVMRYADCWARLMEWCLIEGRTLENCAEEMSHLADNEGITGFMHSCAVSILTKTWLYGKDLKQALN